MKFLLPALFALLSSHGPERAPRQQKVVLDQEETSSFATNKQLVGRQPTGWLEAPPLSPWDRRTFRREECHNRNTTDYDEVAAFDDPAGRPYPVKKNGAQVEVSPFYRRDRREVLRGVPPPSNVTGLRTLLRHRYEARKRFRYIVRRQTGEGGGGAGAASASSAAQDEVVTVDRLLQEWHGVVVYDSPPIWTTTTTTTSGVDDGDFPEEPVGQRRKREERATRRLVELYGPLGHPYQPQLPDTPTTLDPLCTGLDAPAMHRLLSKRERLRLEGRYEEADAVKLELWIQGIRVSDATQKWAPARSRSRRPEGRGPSNDFDASSLRTVDEVTDEASEQTYHYTEDAKRSVGFPNENYTGGGSAPGEQQQQQQQVFFVRRRVEQLLECRLRAVARGDICTTHHLDLELHRTYRVRIDDHQRVWWVVAPSEDEGGRRRDAALVDALRKHVAREEEAKAAAFTPASVIPIVMLCDAPDPTELPYHWSTASMELEHGELFRSRVDYLVRHRAWKREEGKFLEADAIRRELWCTYNVGLTDRLRQCSVGGIFDEAV